MREDIAVVSRGEVPDDAVGYARQKIGHVIEWAALPVLFARVKLLQHHDPARERPAEIEVSLDISGDVVRAHQAARDFRTATDLVEARLQNRLRHMADHRRLRTGRG